MDGIQLSQGYRATTRRQFTFKSTRMCTFSYKSINNLNPETYAESTGLADSLTRQSGSSMFS